jgi:hypothetical protein
MLCNVEKNFIERFLKIKRMRKKKRKMKFVFKNRNMTKIQTIN